MPASNLEVKEGKFRHAMGLHAAVISSYQIFFLFFPSFFWFVLTEDEGKEWAATSL